MSNLETTDIFKGAFYLCMDGDLSGIRFKTNGKQIATFHFNGPELYRHDKAYINGHALVNPVQFRAALNHLRDILFNKLRENNKPTPRLRQAGGRYENDRKRENRTYQSHD